MSNVKVQLPLDKTGRAPNNLISSEEHTLASYIGFPYKMIVLEHGGFYARSLRVYDSGYNRLTLDVDYIVTYVYQNASEDTGLEICGLITFLDPTRVGKIFCSAQMVGGDLAFSFTCESDYVRFVKSKPIGYIPTTSDYIGNEPIWKPGELEKERWRLDTFQPFNNEIERIAQVVQGGDGVFEDEFQEKVDLDVIDFLSRFNDRLDRHIDDKANPHTDLKLHIGLSLVANYMVATDNESIDGTSNELFLTPAGAGAALEQWVNIPLKDHIDDKNNPHDVSLAQTGAVSYATVDTTAGAKYNRNETVYNSENGILLNGNIWNYTDFYKDWRLNIPADNFASGGAYGYVNPNRLGRGNPDADKILMSNGTWVNIDSLAETYAGEKSPSILVMQMPNVGPAQAHALAIQQPWAWSAPVGSMILYTLNTQYWWGTGNGGVVTGHNQVFGSILTASGWVQM